MSRSNYAGYYYERRKRLSIPFLALTIAIFGIAFVGLLNYSSIKIAVAALILSTATLTAFLRMDYLPHLFLLSLLYPRPLAMGPLHLFPPDLVFMLMIVAVGIRAARQKETAKPPFSYTLVCALFIISLTLSSLKAANIMRTLPEIIQFFYYIFGIPFIVMNLLRKREAIENLLKFFVFAMTMESLLIILQFFLMTRHNTIIASLFPYANRGGSYESLQRSFGSVGGGVGMFFCAAVAISLNAFLEEREKLVKRLIYLIPFALCLFAITCTGLRAALVVVSLICLFLPFLKRKFLLVMVMLFGMLVMALFAMTSGRDMYPFKLFFGHTSHRSEDITQALNTFYQNQLLGVGPMQFKRHRPWGERPGAENEFVRRLAEGGLIGGVIFIIWSMLPLIFCLKAAIRARDPAFESLAVATGFCFFVFTAHGFISSDVFNGGHGHLMVFFAGLALGLHSSLTPLRRASRGY